jgi:hypothetical protein
MLDWLFTWNLLPPIGVGLFMLLCWLSGRLGRSQGLRFRALVLSLTSLRLDRAGILAVR